MTIAFSVLSAVAAMFTGTATPNSLPSTPGGCGPSTIASMTGDQFSWSVSGMVSCTDGACHFVSEGGVTYGNSAAEVQGRLKTEWDVKLRKQYPKYKSIDITVSATKKK